MLFAYFGVNLLLELVGELHIPSSQGPNSSIQPSATLDQVFLRTLGNSWQVRLVSAYQGANEGLLIAAQDVYSRR
jgi:hypothetical protein